MMKQIVMSGLLFWVWTLPWAVWAVDAPVVETETHTEITVDQMIQHIQEAGQRLTSFQADLIYDVNQPEMDSRFVRKGLIAYQRDPNHSFLRVAFYTLQEDDLPEVIRKEIFYFDGVWLTHVSYDAKSITQRQMTPEDQPADAFELASQSMPLVGFTDMDELTRHFDISRIELVDSPERLGLLLRVKPDSDYHKEYTQLTFEIDPEKWLPAKVVAIASGRGGDREIHTIVFDNASLNQPIDPELFLIKKPEGFGQPEIIPLEK